MLLAGALLVVIVFRTTRSARAATGSRRLVVLPMDYEAGDSSLAYVAAGLAEGVARRLNGVGGLEVRSGARSEWPAATRRDFKEIARRFGSTVMLKTSLARTGDSLEVRASIVDAESATESPVRPRRFAVADIRDAESVLAASVAGALFQKPLPAAPTAVASIDPESYRLMLQGVYQLLSAQDLKAAGKSFEESTRLDVANARAWAGLSSVWAAQTVTDRVPFEDGFERATAAAEKALALDSLQGSAWANLGLLRALKERTVSVGKALIDRASAVEPSNPEVLLIRSALFRSAWRWDEARDAIRLARELDPLSPFLMEREASVELCADRPQAALRLVDAELVLSPTDRLALTARVRSLARLGRFDDAIAAWRALALAARNDSLAVVLSRARGEGGYWAARHLEGRGTRERLEKGVPQLPWVSSLVAIQARFAAGDTAEAFAALDAAAREPLPALYRLPCMPALDEVRRTPHYRAIVARIGALPER